MKTHHILKKYIYLYYYAVFYSLFIPVLVIAGSFSIVPTRVHLEPKNKTSTFKITNNSDYKINFQVEVVAWNQDEKGRDRYTKTDDIVFFPKIFTCEANEDCIVRIGYKGTWPAQERAYRVYLNELPVSTPGRTELRMVMRMGVPVFVRPGKQTTESAIEIEGIKVGEDNLLVPIKNNGGHYFVVRKIKASGLDSSGTKTFSREIPGWYILPGIVRHFSLDVSAIECKKTVEIQVAVDGDETSRTSKLALNRSVCAQLPETSSAQIEKGQR